MQADTEVHPRMSERMTHTIAAALATRMRADGFTCKPSDVWAVWENGEHENEALASRLLSAFDEYGLVAA